MTPVWQKKRFSRIARHAIPEVQEAFARDEITARRADILSDLPRSRQKQKLQRWLAIRESKARTYRLAAQAINAYLGELGGAKPALPEIAERVRTALKS
jgi:hypothetical protein